MLATLIASWQRVAEGSGGASVERVQGATAGVFPGGPERGIYNNAVVERGLDESAAAEAVGAIGRLYADAGVGRYAVWAHESEAATIADLVGRGFKVDTWTRAMAMPLDEMDAEPPRIQLGPSEWGEHLRYLRAEGLPDGLLEGVDGDAFTFSSPDSMARTWRPRSPMTTTATAASSTWGRCRALAGRGSGRPSRPSMRKGRVTAAARRSASSP